MSGKLKMALMAGLAILLLASCDESSERTDAKSVNEQQQQYAIAQPIPRFDWSLERSLVIQLYEVRNKKVATHAVWRGNTSVIEGDCPSIGYGIPYDTSLTNPWKSYGGGYARTSIGQAEPNGIFASTNTAATWIFCISESGALEPIYVESKVTVYPYAVKVDYEKNRVFKAGKANVTMSAERNGKVSESTGN